MSKAREAVHPRKEGRTMNHKACIVMGAALALAACATQEPPKPAPEPVSAPAPEPKAVEAPKPPPPQPVVEKARIAAQVLFDFDRATIKPEGRTVLDDFVANARDVSVEALIVTGHADRIGTEAYNRGLSQRRADAVKSYLVSKGFQTGRVYAEGKGESQPLTGDKCRKMGREDRRNAKLIACLQ